MTPNYLIEIYAVIHAARIRTRRSVVLVPQAKYEETIRTISALSDTPFSGRTVVWPDTGHKLTVAHAGQEVFVPRGVPFDLFLAGFGISPKSEAKSLLAWRDAARSLVPCSDWMIGSQYMETQVMPRA